MKKTEEEKPDITTSGRFYKIIIQDEEFYSHETPAIFSGTIKFYDLIKKNIIQENILSEVLIQCYSEKIGGFEISLFEQPVELRFVHENDLEDWLKQTKEEAEKKLKDEILEYYKIFVPEMMSRLNSLEKLISESNNTKAKQKNLLI